MQLATPRSAVDYLDARGLAALVSRLDTESAAEVLTMKEPSVAAVPLVTILVGTQVLNAVLLVPLLFAMIGLSRDPVLMGRFRIGRAGTLAYGVTTAAVVLCVAVLAVTSLTD